MVAGHEPSLTTNGKVAWPRFKWFHHDLLFHHSELLPKANVLIPLKVHRDALTDQDTESGKASNLQDVERLEILETSGNEVEYKVYCVLSKEFSGVFC